MNQQKRKLIEKAETVKRQAASPLIACAQEEVKANQACRAHEQAADFFEHLLEIWMEDPERWDGLT